jgi:hypothetical protein
VFGFQSGQLLYPFESAIVNEVALRLSADAAALLQRQMLSINKVQRLARGKEVNLYCMRRGKAQFDDALRFRDTRGEALLATATVRNPGTNQVIACELWLANGRLFSFLFDKPPGNVFSRTELKTARPSVSDVRILFDPMSARPLAKLRTPSTIEGWVARWRDNGLIADVRPPLDERLRMSILKGLDCRLPDDYLELLNQTDGLRIGGIEVHGLEGLRKVVTPLVNYHVLAEGGPASALLLVAEGSDSGELFLVTGDDPDPRNVGRSFDTALDAIVAPAGSAVTIPR